MEQFQTRERGWISWIAQASIGGIVGAIVGPVLSAFVLSNPMIGELIARVFVRDLTLLTVEVAFPQLDPGVSLGVIGAAEVELV